jgi:hypothetical protein
MPTSFMGAACTPAESPDQRLRVFAVCLPRDFMRQAGLTVGVGFANGRSTHQSLARGMVEAMSDNRILRQSFRTFRGPNLQNPVGLFGAFETERGTYFIWMLEDASRVTMVMTMTRGQVDVQAMMAEVETKIFGSLVMGDTFAYGSAR